MHYNPLSSTVGRVYWRCVSCRGENKIPGRRVTVSFKFGDVEELGVRKCVGSLPP